MLSGPLKTVICLALFLLNIFYCLKLPCMKIYKHAFLQIRHPCFTRAWVPCIPLLVESSPQVPVYKDHDIMGWSKICHTVELFIPDL